MITICPDTGRHATYLFTSNGPDLHMYPHIPTSHDVYLAKVGSTRDDDHGPIVSNFIDWLSSRNH